MTAAKPKHLHKPTGRPSLYADDYPRRGYRLAEVGMTDVQMAAAFGIGVRTLYSFYRRHPDFRQAIGRGKAIADAAVAAALFRRAVGYSHPAERIVLVAGPAGEGSRVERVPYVEHYLPDTAAILYWLNNRQRQRWSSRAGQGNAAPGGGPVMVTFVLPLPPSHPGTPAGMPDGRPQPVADS